MKKPHSLESSWDGALSPGDSDPRFSSSSPDGPSASSTSTSACGSGPGPSSTSSSGSPSLHLSAVSSAASAATSSHPLPCNSINLKRGNNNDYLPAISTTANPGSALRPRASNNTNKDAAAVVVDRHGSSNGNTDESLVLSSTGKHSPALPLLTTSALPILAIDDSGGSTNLGEKQKLLAHAGPTSPMIANTRIRKSMAPASITKFVLMIAGIGLALLGLILHSMATRQVDTKGCRMSYMRPGYIRFDDFDTEYTRFASKYSLYLYREHMVDEPANKVILKGIPVLFIPGNAGSYKQVRPIAAETASFFAGALATDEEALARGVRPLDIFTADFNEDFTAFHGQILHDQADYLNEAIRYILSLYTDPSLSVRDRNLPDPTSVIILGHSMGGVVARTMLLRPDYQYNSINTIVTMAAPHSHPPVTFDQNIVNTYNDINNYWRWAYSQQHSNDNPLDDVTLVSIAGGTLDTVVPSDYSAVETIVPDSHGFTIFTTGIPTVWTSMDHQAILWCDQFRKVITRALYEIVNVSRASQTKSRADRMRVFRKWLLSGFENDAEKLAPSSSQNTLLTLGSDPNMIASPDERLVVRNLGINPDKKRTWLLPVPTHLSAHGSKFTFMTDAKLDQPGEQGKLEVLLCSVVSTQSGHSSPSFTWFIDNSNGASGTTKMACKSATPDVILMPASTKESQHPFWMDPDHPQPLFSYLQYDVATLSDYQFIAVVDKASEPSHHMVVAEFTNDFKSVRVKDISLGRLAMFGTTTHLPVARPLVSEMKIPAIYSGLLAFKVEISGPKCGKEKEPLFAPLVRQYSTRPYESKFFVNAREIDINLHGQSPYVSSIPLRSSELGGLTLQVWTDPTCASQVRINIQLDVLGSLGKLYMRYRTIVAAVPLAIVVLVMICQFSVYNNTGVFIGFLEALDLCMMRHLLVLLVASLAIMFMFHWQSVPAVVAESAPTTWKSLNGTLAPIPSLDNTGLLLGTSDLFFWYLIPMIGAVCIGVCVALHYVALLITYIFNLAYTRLVPVLPATPTEVSTKWRVSTTGIALLLVTTVIPYELAYLVACIVQLMTTTRALRQATENRSPTIANFHHYCHTILLLMLWVLPINLPGFIVWVRNLMVHWLTPFSSKSNLVCIAGFILLVEHLRTMRMIPRVASPQRDFTALLLACTALFTAVYGVSYAYMLHHMVHMVATWLAGMHYFSTPAVRPRKGNMGEARVPFEGRKRGKTP